jgi:hypothetical protein
MDKNFYFVCGLPRAGNTLLATLINQNKDVSFGANSLLAEVLYQTGLLKTSETFKLFPDEKSFNNLLNGIFDSYYKDFEAKNILMRAPWGTPANLFMINAIIKNPKFIILYRPVLECLASIIKLEKPEDIELRCDQLMDREYGIIGKNLWSIENIIKEKEKYTVVHYNNLVKDPEKEIKKICNFLKIAHKKIKIKNFEQLLINGVTYDDTILNAPFHKLRTDKIKKEDYKIKDILSKDIIKKFSKFDVL